MKVLLDTNVVLDYLGANQGFTEDAVQYTVAEANGVYCIISRNTKDFEEKTIPCYNPQEFLKKFKDISGQDGVET